MSAILQVALLSLSEFDRAATFPGSIVKGACAKLSHELQDVPSLNDYITLRALGYAERTEGSRLHTVTASGRAKAASIVREVCRVHSLHFMVKEHRDASGTHYGCACGSFSHIEPGSPQMDALARRAFNRHVERMARKMFYRSKSLSEAGSA